MVFAELRHCVESYKTLGTLRGQIGHEQSFEMSGFELIRDRAWFASDEYSSICYVGPVPTGINCHLRRRLIFPALFSEQLGRTLLHVSVTEAVLGSVVYQDLI